MTDFLLGACIGVNVGMLLGLIVGVRQFRRGIEDGLRLHDIRDALAAATNVLKAEDARRGDPQ